MLLQYLSYYNLADSASISMENHKLHDVDM